MNCCICGPVKNCGPYLQKVLENMAKIGSLFEDYQIIIYYDKSCDNTLDILKGYQQKNPKMIFYVKKYLMF
jgi:glycosyltransferase involved in cell wall biosynthesis